MIQKTWRCLLSALIVLCPLTVVPFNTAVQADPNPQNQELDSYPPLSSTLKVGETRSQALSRSQPEAIAKIHPYQIGGKSAATLYVRNIPILTFVDTKLDPKVKYPSLNISSKISLKLPSKENSKVEIYSSNDPVERATSVAALLNQLARDGFDANGIVPVWQSGSYALMLGDSVRLNIDNSLIVPNSSKNGAKDALTTANMLRRLIGKAQPLTNIVGLPIATMPKTAVPKLERVAKKIKPSYRLSIALVTQIISGMASWYGPGFHGGTTANGERFNQYTLTAAHPNLPFGTPVRVTNKYNGRSVVVRINDRGPYSGGRVIDLSKGAAQVIGLVSSGVAPVRLEIMRR